MKMPVEQTLVCTYRLQHFIGLAFCVFDAPIGIAGGSWAISHGRRGHIARGIIPAA